MTQPDPERVHRPTLLRRLALRRMLKTARKRPGEALTSDDWAAYYLYVAQPTSRAFTRVLRSLPRSPRCSYCGAPFAGFGARLVGPLGYRPSRKNPTVCATCVELTPPGGMTMEAGVLFADLRGFTALSEDADPEEVNALLGRFYSRAEHVLFPEALIDKLIGDEVMALYLPVLLDGVSRRLPAALRDGDDDRARALFQEARGPLARIMLDHARELVAAIGYGSAEGAFVEVGIGLDYGEAFVGNIGDKAVHDFTAVGDVVNTASRLQGEARGGEILVSSRLAAELDEPPGEPEELAVEGKAQPVVAYRLTANRHSPTTG